MIIYDYYKEMGGLGFAIFAMISLVSLGVIVWQIPKIFRFFFNRDMDFAENKIEIYIRIFFLIISIILCMCFLPRSVKLGKGYYQYKSQNYSIASGILSDITAVRDDYRDEELYDISFCVDDTMFANTNISCDRELLEKLLNSEGKTITVSFSQEYDEQIVYQIKVLQ